MAGSDDAENLKQIVRGCLRKHIITPYRKLLDSHVSYFCTVYIDLCLVFYCFFSFSPADKINMFAYNLESDQMGRYLLSILLKSISDRYRPDRNPVGILSGR